MNDTPKKRGRPKKEQVSDEAKMVFPDVIPVEDRKNILDSDVEDIFGELEGEDLRSKEPKEHTPSESYYAKRQDRDLNQPTVDDINAEPHKTITSPALTDENLGEMIRAEELAADLVRAKGRFIEGVDNAKPGVTFRGPDPSINPEHLDSLEGIEYNSPLPVHQEQYIQKPKRSMRADGITLKGVLDTGIGAQVSEKELQVSDRDNPESPNFMVCVNKECRYREHCLRYRMSNQRSMKSVFYPEDCRRDGIYMNTEESDFTAYDPMQILESTSTPSF